METELLALVLTGGESQRMGVDKAQLYYGDEPQWARLGRMLQELRLAVFWSCRQDQQVSWSLGDRAILDSEGAVGPAAGLLAAHDRRPDVAWLVVACDYPLVGIDELRRLASARDRLSDATAFRNPLDGRPEPLLAIWEPRALVRLSAAVATGRMSARATLEEGTVTLVEGNGRNLCNVNTPHDRRRLLEEAHR